MADLFVNIEQAMKTINRDWGCRRVYPHQVIPVVGFQCSERTMRRYMASMAQQGMLVRISRRGGYRLAS